MKIVKIAKIKNKPLYSVETDNGNFIITDFLLAKNVLVRGLNIKPDLLHQLEKETNFEMAFRRALIYLSYRKRSQKEVEDKLKFLKYSDEVIEWTVKKLHDNKYLSDIDYARAFASDALNLKGYGKNRIYYLLKNQKVDSDTINKIISEISLSSEIKAAKKIATKKRSTLNKEKIKQTLYKRGFSKESINALNLG
jgi:regulatory protein